MKEPISSYEDYCRVWAEVYKKHARHAGRSMFSCYVRQGIINALKDGPSYPRPYTKVTTDEDLVGVYIVRALVAQGMRESAILEYTSQMQGYVNAAEIQHDCVALMEQGLYAIGVYPHAAGSFIVDPRNRLRYLWAKHGGFELLAPDL